MYRENGVPDFGGSEEKLREYQGNSACSLRRKSRVRHQWPVSSRQRPAAQLDE